jgi:hypothetical protein
MTMPPFLLAISLLVLMASSVPSVFAAKQLQIYGIETPTLNADFELPKRGLSKAQVEQRFGAPARQVGAVGEPPISRWIYSKFTVYFEGDRVIHAVVTTRKQAGG